MKKTLTITYEMLYMQMNLHVHIFVKDLPSVFDNRKKDINFMKLFRCNYH